MSEASSEPGCELQRPHDWIRYALPLLAVWLTYWLALFPGLISLDSVNQWGQIVTGRYDDWHPVFHTWVLWLLSRPGHSLGTVSLVQVVLTAVLLGHALSAARQLGVPGWLIWTAVAWFVLPPVFGVGTIAVWKDNAFGLTTLWTVVLLLRAVRRWTMTSASSLWFGIALALMSLFRHNGHLVAIPTLGVAAWGFRPSRVMAIRSTLVGVLLVTLVIGVTRAAHIPHAHEVLKNTLLWLGMATGPHFRFQWPVVLLAPVAACLSGTRQSARPASGSSRVRLQRSRRGAEADPEAASPATTRPRPSGTPGRGQSPAVVSKAPRTRSAEKHSRATSAAWALARG